MSRSKRELNKALCEMDNNNQSEFSNKPEMGQQAIYMSQVGSKEALCSHFGN